MSVLVCVCVCVLCGVGTEGANRWLGRVGSRVSLKRRWNPVGRTVGHRRGVVVVVIVVGVIITLLHKTLTTITLPTSTSTTTIFYFQMSEHEGVRLLL